MKTRNLFPYLLFVVSLNGCFLFNDDKKKKDPIDINKLTPQDKPVCNPLNSNENTVTVSGQALFEYRVPAGAGLSNAVETPKKIRFAEIEVFTPSNQCVTSGQTDGQGEFSLQVPHTGTPVAYTIKVNARADNEQIKASVQNDPLNYQHHFISRTLTLENNQPVSGLVMKALADEEGGAFNIYDQILKANLFLREQTANCQNFNCTPFTVAPKVYVYWSKGVNPVTYLKNSKGSFSFYLPNRSQLFIVGGSNGNISTVNTDHFDNIIILHEYGHFIEDHFSKTDTPGGSHAAKYVIDPRLAWSEGFATFFASAIFGQATYIDSHGVTPSGRFKINEDLEKHPPTRDVSQKPGEGNFREFSITRALYDMIDPYTFQGTTIEDKDNDSINGQFVEFWSVFSQSFKEDQRYFRDYGLFMKLHSQMSNKTDLAAIFAREQQKPNRDDYASDFPQDSSMCPKMIQAQDLDNRERQLFGSYPQNSDQHGSNDFYLYQHAGGTLSVQLTYSPTDSASSSPEADLDLYIYENHYKYQREKDILASSTKRKETGEDSGTEAINVDAPNGPYMINVLVWTRRGNQNHIVELGSQSTYNLTINGVSLCP